MTTLLMRSPSATALPEAGARGADTCRGCSDRKAVLSVVRLAASREDASMGIDAGLEVSQERLCDPGHHGEEQGRGKPAHEYAVGCFERAEQPPARRQHNVPVAERRVVHR